jgi:hypothetical protein
VIIDIHAMAAGFESFSVKFAGRKSNFVEHKLARSAKPMVCNLSAGVAPELIWAELCIDVN